MKKINFKINSLNYELENKSKINDLILDLKNWGKKARISYLYDYEEDAPCILFSLDDSDFSKEEIKIILYNYLDDFVDDYEHHYKEEFVLEFFEIFF